MKYSLKNIMTKTIFTLTIFEILLFKGRLVLGPAQQVQGSEMVNCLLSYHLAESTTRDEECFEKTVTAKQI